MSGYLRSIKENYNNLKKYILNNHDTDIYIHITISDDPKYMNSKITLDELYNLLKPKHMIVSNNYILDENMNTNNLLNQNYKYYILNRHRKIVEKAELCSSMKQKMHGLIKDSALSMIDKEDYNSNNHQKELSNNRQSCGSALTIFTKPISIE